MTALKICAFMLVLVLGFADASNKIKHIIVLMQENRAFDHLLGHYNRINPEVEGLSPSSGNWVVPNDKSSTFVPVNEEPFDTGPDDPCHAFDCVTQQIFGTDKLNSSSTPDMSGFVANALSVQHGTHNAMSSWNETTLPVLYKLAQEYALFDHWFCSVPGPTNPNREFLMSGTSHGATDNNIPTGGFPQPTHYDLLAQHNKTWRIYYSDNPWGALFFASLRTPANKKFIRPIEELYTDLASGDMPQFTFIEPRMSASKNGPSTWEHPDASVRAAEAFYGKIYESVRASPVWNNSAMILTYDEHGGFFDHVSPPQEGVPPPDSHVSPEGFRFDRLGVRIPTIVISPFVKAGTVVHGPPAAQSPTTTSQYDATSIIATTNYLLGVDASLTMRDAWAGRFEHVFELDEPRTDCPVKMPSVEPFTVEELETEMSLPVNHHQEDQMNILCEMNEDDLSTCGAEVRNQGECGVFLASQWQRFVATKWA